MEPFEVLRRVEGLEKQLSQQSVPIVEAKKSNPPGAFIGIALLLALLSSIR